MKKITKTVVKPKKVVNIEITPTPIEIAVPVVSKISKLQVTFGRSDLDSLVEKLNEVIDKLN